MNCQRCQANEAEYLVYTDTINFKVCIFCALTAKEIGITPEVLHGLRTDHQQINQQLFHNTVPAPCRSASCKDFP